jgi:TPR repeat protein
MRSLGAGYFFHGTGAKDTSEALMWLRRAAKLGVEDAKEILVKLGDR